MSGKKMRKTWKKHNKNTNTNQFSGITTDYLTIHHKLNIFSKEILANCYTKSNINKKINAFHFWLDCFARSSCEIVKLKQCERATSQFELNTKCAYTKYKMKLKTLNWLHQSCIFQFLLAICAMQVGEKRGKMNRILWMATKNTENNAFGLDFHICQIEKPRIHNNLQSITMHNTRCCGYRMRSDPRCHPKHTCVVCSTAITIIKE